MKSKTIITRDLKYNWHPYTQMKDCRELPPIPIASAKGIKLYDYKGKSYYDTISSWWCNIHGHGHPFIKKAIKKQLDSLEHVLFAGFTHKPAVELAEKLLRIVPKGLEKVFYSDNGSTAVEVAMKMSFQYWKNKGEKNKERFLSLDRGYHGDTVGAMSVSGVDQYNKIFEPLFFQGYKAPTPYCYRCPVSKTIETCSMECVGSFEKILRANHRRIAAVVVEPLLMGAGGMIIYPAEYLRKIWELSKKYNVHFIVDEVATGFGRTGKMFACERASVTPDFMCLSKGITSGYLPLGVTLTTQKIYDAFYADYLKNKTFFHGHTYTANPIACAAGAASLDLFKIEKTLDNVRHINSGIKAFLEYAGEYDFVGGCRDIGVVGAFEILKDKKRKLPYPAQKRIGLEIYKAGLKRGILLRPLGNVIYFFLPLCVREDELSEVFDAARDVLHYIKKKL